MYTPEHFKVTDRNEINRFINENGFGQLISNLDNRLYSTHIPFILNKEKDKLLGHVAKQNPQVNELQDQEVLITFQGPHDYISPTWYSSKGVPTWNYQAVHVYGKCQLIYEPEQLDQLVRNLTEQYEINQATPWEAEFNPNMLKAIIGVEIVIDEIQCQYKLSQNRSDKDRYQVINQLEKNGSLSLAKAMKDNIK